jgi:hypothetical protein
MSRIHPSHSHADALTIYILSTLCTAPGLCNIASLAVLFGSNGNSYTVSVQSDTLVGRKELKLTGAAVKAA